MEFHTFCLAVCVVAMAYQHGVTCDGNKIWRELNAEATAAQLADGSSECKCVVNHKRV